MEKLPQLYQEVVSDVIGSCSTMFSESGLPLEILMQLEQLWIRKIIASGNNYVDLDRILLEKVTAQPVKKQKTPSSRTPTVKVKKNGVIRYKCKSLIKATDRSMPEIGFHERKLTTFPSQTISLHSHAANGVIATGGDSPNKQATDCVIVNGSPKRRPRRTNLTLGKQTRRKKQHNTPQSTLKNSESMLQGNANGQYKNVAVPPPAHSGIIPSKEEVGVSLMAPRSDVPGQDKTESLTGNLKIPNDGEVCVNSVASRNGLPRKGRIKKATIPTNRTPYSTKLRSARLCNADFKCLRTPRRPKKAQRVKPQTPCELNCVLDSRSKEPIIHKMDETDQSDKAPPNPQIIVHQNISLTPVNTHCILNGDRAKTGTGTTYEMNAVNLSLTQLEPYKTNQVSVTKIDGQKWKKRRRLTNVCTGSQMGNDSQYSGLRLRSGALRRTYIRPRARRNKLSEQLNIDGQCDTLNKLELNCDSEICKETDFNTTPKELDNPNKDEQCDNLTDSGCKTVLRTALNSQDLGGAKLNSTPETTNRCDTYVPSELKRDGNFELLCASKCIRVRDYLADVNERLENNSFETSDLCQHLTTGSVPRQLQVVGEGERPTRTNGNFAIVNGGIRGKLRYNGNGHNRNVRKRLKVQVPVHKQLANRRSSGGSRNYSIHTGSNRRAIKLVRNSLGGTMRNRGTGNPSGLEMIAKQLSESEVQSCTNKEVLANEKSNLAMANCNELASILNLNEHTSTYQLRRAKPIRLRRDYKRDISPAPKVSNELFEINRIITKNGVNNYLALEAQEKGTQISNQFNQNVPLTTDLVLESKDTQADQNNGTQIIQVNQNDHECHEVGRYSYTYQNPYANRKVSKSKRVKISLPPRDGFTKDQLTCTIKVPPWALQGSTWTKLLIPIIKRIHTHNLPMSDATSLLQDYIDNYQQPVLQVDGVGAKFILKSCIKHSPTRPNQSVRSNSNIDSNDDVTDEEDAMLAFQAKNLIWCQFANVKHRKNVWHLNLKHGVMYLNGKEYFFNSAEGIVTW